ncbi:hypothetical protein PVAP13_4KG341000 [Panicum virgatum]|uniref:Transmembrane 9 superfamily member n=1 Tax=Panicum virgatum TaxID=38727 RepID=A0A8T0TX90_PANVG|nr:hypothetical protein PVAP13_4KG341000 [Panicum virgatum]
MRRRRRHRPGVLPGRRHLHRRPGVLPARRRPHRLPEERPAQLSSVKTQVPYPYYSLPFCRPDTIVNSAGSLGELLRGDRIESSPYVFEMMEPKLCQVACRIVLSQQGAKDFKEKIDDEYHVNMILDNVPMVIPVRRLDKEAPLFYLQGICVGVKGRFVGRKDSSYFIHNHLLFLVKYNRDAHTGLARIVGFEVKPFSVKHELDGDLKGNMTRLETCNPHSGRLIMSSDRPQEIEANKEIIFTYDVNFEESDIKRASRWDTRLNMPDEHWFNIGNSLMTVLFLSVMVAMVMIRTLYRDISMYNQLENQEEAQESGWKLLHGDVFRPPVNADLLCVFVGTGVQFFGMLIVTLLIAILGLLSPSNGGGFMTAMILPWVFMGLFAGYSTARLYKMLGGSEWKKVSIKTALVVPGAVFLIIFTLNILLWMEKSSGAVPFTTMFALVFLWLGVSLPLTFIGSFLGFNKTAIDDPVMRTNKIPRPIPEQPWYMNPPVSVLIGGILPFGAVFMKLFYILTAIWIHQSYYAFGIAFLVFMILVVTCAEISIVLCSFHLCNEDHRWWWRSYLTSGSSALYLFLYTTFYFFTNHQAAVHKGAPVHALLRLHVHLVLCLLRANRHHWLLRLPVVHQAHILFTED